MNEGDTGCQCGQCFRYLALRNTELEHENGRLRATIVDIGSQEYTAPPGADQDSVEIGVSMAAFWAIGQIRRLEENE